MLFTEPAFLFYFLPGLLLVYSAAGRQLKNLVLLVASLLFYAWGEPALVVLLLASISGNYLLGLWIDSEEGGRRRWVTGLGVAGNLLLLGHYKYFSFVVENLSALLLSLGLSPLPEQAVRLPIGISFFTFQAISYLVDVQRGQAKVQRNPLHVALYISMFPQLIAGPIVRYHDIARQLQERQTTLAGFAYGVRRFIIGLGKKLLLANALAWPADQVFSLAEGGPEGARHLTVALAWLGVLCYSLQIYFDFSGYSDMAIGLARMFGFRLRENFRYPYIAASVTEFWRRWHLSLSTWFRDYLYLPLGGGRGRPLLVYRNLWLVFLLCGIWHGASWNFLIWGAFHGLFLALERACGVRPGQRPWNPLRGLYCCLAVMVGWVFFRAETLTSALAMLGKMVGWGESGSGSAALLATPHVVVVLLLALPGCTPFPRVWLKLALLADSAGTRAVAEVGRNLYLIAVFLLCVLSVAADTYNPFIYFRF